ncbi:MAG TPA: COX15/CtaA family protein [Puia sp.]|nr:COX15/CtaA family protein [Puia sp.]
MNKSLSHPSRAVANWVFIGVGMLLIQVILGGITRLTGSGLSITEWNVVTGAFPPLNSQQWLTEFDKYKRTPQFSLLHADFNLSEFKFIFFWEWFHRLWARLVGVVFIVGFIYLLWKKELKETMIKPLLILFLLGALQGAVGWIMVKSGLTGDAIYVQPTKLALHFVFALILICYAFWFALQLTIPKTGAVPYSSVHAWTWIIIIMLFLQLMFGALMAGNKAAAAASTWPTINGDWIPNSMFKDSPLLINFINNKITIHFVHRGLAYLLLVLVMVWFFKAIRITDASRYFLKVRSLPLVIIFLQMVLGILAVLTSPSIIPNHWGMFEWIAQLHQLTAMLFLLTMLYVLFVVSGRK